MWTAARGAVHGALELHGEELQMGSEGWRIVEDATGRLNGMVLQRKRTMASMERNDLMTVIMTTLAVGLKAGLMKALDNWWLRLADNRDLVGLLLRVLCIQGLMTQGMNQWMNAAGSGYIGCTLVAKSVKTGRRSGKLRTVGSWQKLTRLIRINRRVLTRVDAFFIMAK